MENSTQATPLIHPWVYVWRVSSNKNNYQRVINPSSIIEIVSIYYESKGVPINRAILLGRSRKAMYVVPRYMMWYFIYNYSAKQSLKSIGMMFNRDHSTIINGLTKLKAYCETEPNTKQQFLDISKLLNVEEYAKSKH